MRIEAYSPESGAERARDAVVVPAPVVVVFDFDGTLVRRDSFMDFALRYCASRPLRLLVVAPLIPLSLLLALRSERRAGSLLLWAMTVGVPTRSFALAMMEYARNTLPKHANEAIFGELVRHVEAGRRVVIATGTMPLLVRTLLKERRMGPLPIVGSRVQRRWGGFVAATYCTGQMKARELRRRLSIADWSSVYTNSFADRSLLIRARDITLVDPSRSTIERTQRLIDRGVALRVLRSAR